MANKYVDFVNGSDSNNGAGPDASDSTNKPWKTIGKALGASGAASGDTIYLSPAGPFREVVTPSLTPSAETKLIGDYANAQGFKTSGGVKVTPGPVIWTPYTTNDKTAPSGSTLCALGSKSYFTFQNILFVQGGGYCATASGGGHDYKFIDCVFNGVRYSASGPPLLLYAPTDGSAFNLTIDRCVSITLADGTGGYGGVVIQLPTTASGSADYDANVTIRNSTLAALGTYNSTAAAAGVYVFASGTNTYKGGGVRVYNCLLIGGQGMRTATASQLSTTVPCEIHNSVIIAHYGLNAATSGQLIEDHNLIYAATALTNVTAGTGSVSNGTYAPLMHLFGVERIWGGLPRAFGEPMAGSPLLGFGNDGNQTAYDMRNNPRPAGGQSASPAVGPLERSNTFAQEQATVHTGTNAISVTGPGYQDFFVPVDATATTFSIYCQYDSTYAGTLPQISVLANDEIGVTAQTVTVDSNALNTFYQYSLAAITPSSKGFVTFRVISNDTNGGGKVYFDSFSVA